MALKRKLDEKTWEKLSDEMKPLYAKKGDDYVLDVEGGVGDDDDGAGELRRAHDRTKQELRDAKKTLKELQDQLEAGDELDAKKRGDIEKLEKSWQKKVDDKAAELQAVIDKQSNFIKTTLVDSVAQRLASEISTAPAVILPHIKSRLSADLDGETPTTRVLDKDGKPSALNVDDLKKEFLANKDFSGIIVASKASGGAAKNNGESTSSARGTPQDASKPLASMNPRDLAATMKAKKEAAAANN